MTATLPQKKLIIAALIGSIALTTFTTSLFAQETSEDKTESATGNVGIQVSAPIYNFTIDPGESAQEIVKVRNVGDTTRIFYPEVFDFKPLNETGAPDFIIDAQDDSYTYSLASWVKISTEGIKLEPNESSALNFIINVPADAEPGGHYAGILFGTSPPKVGGTQIAISNKVGSLILVRVAGDAKEQANVEEFSTPKSFLENGPVLFTVRINNTGSVHIQPKGVIEIKNTFGKTVNTISINENSANILPQSIRAFLDGDGNNLNWNPSGLTIGKFTATLTLTYGDPAQNLTTSTSFWIVPWKILLVLLLTIIITILLLVLIIKKYNRWIVAKAQKSPPSTPPAGEDQPPASNASQSDAGGPVKSSSESAPKPPIESGQAGG
ncbi:hypothetical protein IID23_04110 [Patescibacteria group bacterium]|nr:hypothetical protein [Patescibacteria group bacterium]